MMISSNVFAYTIKLMLENILGHYNYKQQAVETILAKRCVDLAQHTTFLIQLYMPVSLFNIYDRREHLVHCFGVVVLLLNVFIPLDPNNRANPLGGLGYVICYHLF